jgi:glycine/D-amino acid oxidase-like deaminating enzyme
MTVSLWQQLEPPCTEIRTGVVIIGAGISGLSAAIECESRGVDAVIVEQDFPGARASGRNAGYLMRGAAENYARACADYGRDRARTLWKFTEDNLTALRALGVSALPSFADRPSCLVALDREEAGDLERSVELLREDGFDAAPIRPGADAPADPIWRSGRPLVAMVNPRDATCSPMELVNLLRSKLRSTHIVQGSRVFAIEPGGDAVTVRARGHTIHARHALVCTNAYARDLLPELAGVVTPNRGQMLAIRPHDPAHADLAFAYYLSHGSEYIRPGPDATVLIGGARKHRELEERTDAEGLNPAVQERLEEWARELITERYEVTARWSGIMGFSPDGLPIIRPCRGFDSRVWFCGGLTGHGMSMGHLTARHAISIMLGDPPSPAGALFAFNEDGSRPGA